MHVIVSLKIELDATASLSQREQQIQQAGRQAMKEALKQAMGAVEQQQSPCPGCGSEQVHPQGTKRRVLLTSFGRVELPLKRWRCAGCGRLFRGAQRCLAEVEGSNITPPLRELAVLAGSSWPYETAAAVLARLSGVQLSHERLRPLTNQQGSMQAQRQHREAQALLQEAVNLPQLRAQRAGSAAGASMPPTEWLQVGLDGGWVPSREQAGGMEGKVGVVACQLAPVGKRGRHRLTARRYVATFGSAEEVGRLTYTAAWELHATEAKRQVVLADGADWIKTQAEEHFPDAVKILDWPHLYRKIRDAVRWVRPGQRADRRAWRKRQYDLLFPWLWEGQREQALAHLRSLRPAQGEPPPALESAIQYLSTQGDWIGDYRLWKEQGYPVGSGLVERAIAVVINVRMKKRGMRWKRENASAVVALRVQRINAEWEAASA